jgi:hypothetical protein
MGPLYLWERLYQGVRAVAVLASTALRESRP